MSEWLVMICLNVLFLLLITPFNLLFFAFCYYRKKIISCWLFLPIIILQFYLNLNEKATGYKHFSSIENHILINYNH